MDPLENVLSPALIDVLNVNVWAELVTLWNVGDAQDNVTRGPLAELHSQVGEVVTPLAEFPLHAQEAVRDQLYVGGLNFVAEDLVLAADMGLWNAGGLGKLAQLGLVGQRLVDDVCGALICHTELCFLNHLQKNGDYDYFSKIIKSLLRMIYPFSKLNKQLDPKRNIIIDGFEYSDFYNYLLKNNYLVQNNLKNEKSLKKNRTSETNQK